MQSKMEFQRKTLSLFGRFKKLILVGETVKEIMSLGLMYSFKNGVLTRGIRFDEQFLKLKSTSELTLFVTIVARFHCLLLLQTANVRLARLSGDPKVKQWIDHATAMSLLSALNFALIPTSVMTWTASLLELFALLNCSSRTKFFF